MYTYLLINFFTVLVPFLAGFHPALKFYRQWKTLFPALFISAAIYIAWDAWFTHLGVWSFNPQYVLGIYIFGLPLEELLFFITIPYSCVFIYHCIAVLWPFSDRYSRAAQAVSVLLIVSSAVLAVLYHDRYYTLSAFGLLAVMLAVLSAAKTFSFLSRFYISYLLSIIPFSIVNGLLTSVPVVLYNNSQNLGLRVGSIPFEDFFYSMGMLLLNTGLYVYFARRSSQ